MRPAVGITSPLHQNIARAAYRCTDARAPQVSSAFRDGVAFGEPTASSKGYIADASARVCSVARQAVATLLLGRQNVVLRCDCGVAGLVFPISLRCGFDHLHLSYVADLNVFGRKQLLDCELEWHEECAHLFRAGL